MLGHGAEAISIFCDCPYSGGGICKHSVAVLLRTDNEIDQAAEHFPNQETYDQDKVRVPFLPLDKKWILAQVDPSRRKAVNYLAERRRCEFRKKDEGLAGYINYRDEDFYVFFEQQGDQLVSRCSCAETTEHPLCLHKGGALLQLFYEEGADAFSYLKNFEHEKNALLEPYGYSMNDEGIEELFEFYVEHQKLKIRPKDKAIVRLDFEDLGVELKRKSEQRTAVSDTPPTQPTQRDDLDIGYAIFFRSSEIVPMQFIPVIGKLSRDETTFVSNLSELTTSTQHLTENLHKLDTEDQTLIRQQGQFREHHIRAEIRQQGIANASTLALLYNDRRYEASSEEVEAVQDYVRGKYLNVFELLRKKRVTFDDRKQSYLQVSRLVPFLEIREKPLEVRFRLYEEGDDLILKSSISAAGLEKVSRKKLEVFYFAALYDNRILFPVLSGAAYRVLRLAVQQPKLRVRKLGVEGFMRKIVLPLLEIAEVEIESGITIHTLENQEPNPLLFIGEKAPYLRLTPVFEYPHNHQVGIEDDFHPVFEHEGSYYNLRRNLEREKELAQLVADSHPALEQQGGSFFLHKDEVFADNWFFTVFDTLKEHGFSLFGFEELETFNYSPYPPKTVFRVSSGIDWFDCEMRVQFGEQFVSLKDVRKSLLKGKQFVQLGDGKLGMLPQEWIEKYGTLLKLGDTDGDTVRLSKLHFSVVDELYEEIDDVAVLEEIEEKKRKLRDFDSIEAVPPSPNVKATLRKYQNAALNWLHFLDEFRWGGCLADDMGLGKTLQALAFLQKMADDKPNLCCFVVVPTSLLFNWTNELEKFTPNIKYLVHHGTDRTSRVADFYDYNVVLTSYGTLVRDIPEIKDLQFDYVILDESQAIKNVSSKRYKAACLLQANNKLVLTGTPVENNTMELYAQMNFLNPGMLGSQQFFKKEYATPIDKKGEQQKAKELRKIIYPFLLRRTKEQVADDLPAKSESILFCEMNHKQRRVYEAFKNYYRDHLLNVIEERGLEKSGVYILEGLLKLRQICDSPALLKDETEYPSESVKIAELMTHLEELVGGHKVLVFSQFVQMLTLIREELEAKEIPYSYLDGKTRNRQAAVQDFQEDDTKRVFLISLKAGGVGLNLTAADYVFLIDPWWNPAVEQQAIDRTHRIGQTRKVFAYRFICKDTVEEKILKLQEKKQALADDIVSTEKSFLKTLTKDDVAELFS